MSDVRQCPRCELRFTSESELKSHLMDDHDVDPEALDNDYESGDDFFDDTSTGTDR